MFDPIIGSYILIPNSLILWNTIWKPKVPIKVSFFLWSAALGRILTVDNLRILTGVVDLLLAGLVSSTSIDLQRFGP